MQFLYHKRARDSKITLDTDDTHYLFKVRRLKAGSTIRVRNLTDDMLYTYSHILDGNKKEASFELIESKLDSNHKDGLHLILAVIDLNDIYEILPYLNSLFVSRLCLFYADFSQRNRILNAEKARKIINYSSMQCGRSSAMDIEIFDSLDSVMACYKKAYFIDFAKDSANVASIESLEKTALHKQSMEGIIIGPEGGFSDSERGKILRRYRLESSLILTSHAASVYVASLCHAAL